MFIQIKDEDGNKVLKYIHARAGSESGDCKVEFVNKFTAQVCCFTEFHTHFIYPHIMSICEQIKSI